MFTSKNLRSVLLSIVFTLLLSAVIASPALAEGGEGESAAAETPPETEIASDSPTAEPDALIGDQSEEGISADGEGQEADAPSTETGAEATPLASDGEEFLEKEVVPPETDGEEILEAEADPLEDDKEVPSEDTAVSDSPEAIEDAPDQAEPASEQAADEAAPNGDPPEADSQEPTAEDTAPADPSGDTEAQEESLTIIIDTDAGGDPIWCPAAVGTPLDGAAGCTVSYGSLNDLITYLSSNEPSVDGKIWIEKDYVSSVNDPGITAFTLDGASLTTMADYAITIQGGWDGLGTKTVDKNDQSEINAHLNIMNWNNDVTITDVEITGAIAGFYGLFVETNGKVTLDRVLAVANDGAGTYINNTTGTEDAIVSNSQFNDNSGGIGLSVSSNGAITLKNVSANSNNNIGAYLTNSSAASDEKVTLTAGTLEFNDNGSDGLRIYSKGAVNLKDITAVGNAGYGGYISNTSGTSAGVTLKGTNIFSENGDNGLNIWSNGTIKASNLINNANTGRGVYLDNNSATSAQKVTLTGASEFKFNGQDGLVVFSFGPISVSNINASDNLENGCYLDNDLIDAVSGVTLTGENIFNSNGELGLEIWSRGYIEASNLTASDNVWNGAQLTNDSATSPKAVILTGENYFENNLDGGLAVYTTGPIKLNKINASNNLGNLAGEGIFLDNSYSGPSKPQNVTLKSYTTANSNQMSGLVVFTYGGIYISNLTAGDNGGTGAILDNYDIDSSLPRPITLNGTNDLSGNAAWGVYVEGFGPITVYNLQANWNGVSGANLHNDYAGVVGGVSVKGTSSFNGNAEGLGIRSNGNILVENVDASNNGGVGSYLHNAIPGASGSVTVGTKKGSSWNNFNDNTYSGLEISSNGPVTLYNISAYGNGDPGEPSPYGYGVLVVNDTASSPKPVKLIGSNSFSGNYTGGLEVQSLGAISASNLYASDNGGSGVYLVNDSDPASQQNVSLSGYNSFHENSEYGLHIVSYGAITASNLGAWGNGLDGVFLDNYIGGTAIKTKPVVLKGSNWFDNTALGDGLCVFSLGPIKASNLSAWGNGSNGAYLDNSFNGADGAVNLLGSSHFGNNGSNGLEIHSQGSIIVKEIESNDNGGFGAILGNAVSGSTGFVSVGTKGTNYFDNNYYSGMEIHSNGRVILANVCANNNGHGGSDGYGVYVDNQLAEGLESVTINGVYNRFDDNYSTGFQVYSYGPITASNLSANGNGIHGVRIVTAYTFYFPQNVTINGTNSFSNNTEIGLQVYTFGNIKVNNLTAESNGAEGATLENCLGAASDDLQKRPITLTGTNTFVGNGSDGLFADSLGVIKGSNLTASGNGGMGANLDNQNYFAGGGIKLSGVNTFENNDLEGLVATSWGAINISNLNANWNGSDGAVLDTDHWSTLQNVTLTGINNFIGNGDSMAHTGSGLVIMTNGQIKVANLTASGNADQGARLDNYTYWSSGTPGIVLTGTNVFYNNYTDGLQLDTMGPVLLSKLTSDANGSDGVHVWANGPVEIVSGSMTNNGSYGWWIWCPDVVTLTGVHAYGNGINSNFTGGGTLIIKRN